MVDEKIVIDYNSLHENIAGILSDQQANEKNETVGLTPAFWLLRIALQKRAVAFQKCKFVIVSADQKPEYQETIRLLEKYKIQYTTFI